MSKARWKQTAGCESGYDPGVSMGIGIDLPCSGNASFTSLGTRRERSANRERKAVERKNSPGRGSYVDLTVGGQHPKDHARCAFLLERPDVFLHDLDLGFRV